MIPTDWQESFILNLYKGKGDALERGNYRGLKLTDQVMKLLEPVLDSFIREIVDIDAMHFGFERGRDTTDAIFIIHQLQEKRIAANKPLYFAFVDLDKAFNPVPRKVLWWALRGLGVEEWAVIQGMYKCQHMVPVNGQYREEFGFESVCIRDLFSAPCFSYLCWKLCRASSVLVCHGSFCMPTTLL